MADIDPDTLLEWLTMGCGDERDMQVIALEQLCMLLLMSDNVDRCFESCPPRSFLPALCHIFMDEGAPDSILEVTARAITYYLDVSAECSRRIVTVDGAVKALCTRLVVVDISSRASKDLAEQCVKVLELMCTREANAIYEAGGLNCMLTFIREHGSQIHKDTLHSAMSVVARLCSKMEPTDETLEHCMDSLSKLLQHEDTYVADVALKCFACLADRFTRRGVDPAPLAKHGLTEELLKKLVSSALACNLNASTNLNASMSESRSSSGNVSIIVSVLSMLCRGSATVTHDLLRSSLPNAIETAMQGDERCVLDTMRLVDLLLIILFEGREALPKSVFTTTRGTLSASRTPKTDSSGEKSHRQLIDCIRSKDTDALVTAVASSAFDVNFMDDVGQTLLNWASAFGTLEMVEFLCERGSDVNRGQRSSSLHYAACFGRPAVAKVLLKYGANPELRDEDGKTPLDKARERTDEGHKEVVKILQSPGEWMALALENSNKQNENKEDDAKESGEKENDAEEIATDVVKGDPEMAPVYVKHLVPVFANTYQGSLLQSVKKSTLSILKKIIHYMPSTMMKNLISNHLASQLVEVVAVALTSEEDEHGQLSAFHCVQDLMLKAGDMFLIHFIRLGVLQRITDMVNDSGDLVAVADDQIIQGNAPEILKDGSSQDASKVTPGCPYHWHDWCIVRGRDCLYIWSDFCAIELSNGSNGWFRFVLDGKLATMYSSGSPEGGSSSSESRSEFLDKLQRARSAVPADAISQSILSSPSNRPITVENWTLKCRSENQLAIINSDGQQTTVLKEDLPGFFFESNRGTKHTFTAETSLGADFSYSWSGKAGKKYQSKKDQLRQDLCTFARNLYQKYFKDADLTPHGSMAILHKISETLNSCTHSDGLCSGEKKELVLSALQELRELILSEEMLSSYEIQKSGLVDALNNCLNKAVTLLSQSSISHLPRDEPYVSEKFKEVFQNSAETEESSPAILKLVHKLVTVLESTEKLPVLTYEGLGGGSGLQVLLRRLRFKLERDSSSSTFIDRSGKCIKMEPLTTVSEVKKYLLKTVAKQWYDYERSTFKFISCFQDENAQPIEFTYESDFDENGVLYWIGTNAKSVQEWTNPARQHIVNVMSSEGRSLPYGKLEDVINRDSQAVNCHTNDDKTAWFSIDLGVYVIPIKYTLRHSRGYGRSALRNWLFQVSNDGVTWVTLKQHDNDDSLNEPSSVASWDIPTEAVANESKGWHIVRIQQNGVNASGQTYYLSVSGFEVYGKVTGVLPNLEVVQSLDMDSAQRRQRRVYRSQILRHMALASKEGNDLKLFGHHGKKVLVNSQKSDKAGWVNVAWPQVSSSDDAKTNTDADCNFKVVDISDPEVQAAMYEVEKKEKNKTNLSNSHQSTLDNALRQVVMSFGKKKNKTDEDTSKSFDKDNVKLNVDKENKSNNNNADAHKSLDSCSGSRIDLANLQFLMAVEDLLDSPSSDLVASALAEAASMHVDQLRLATRSFRSSLLETSKSRPTPSAQGSRESQSPASELNTNPLLESHYNNTVLSASETVESKTVSESTPDKDSSAKEFDMNDIQKAMESSMSSVLDSMRQNEAESYNEDDDNDNDDDDEDDDDFDTNDVEENNFINDQESPMEPNVISIIHSLNDCCSSDDECRFDDKNDINESVVEAQIQITSNDTEIQNFDSKADDKIIEMTDQQENKREADVTEKTKTSNGLSEFLESADTIEKADDMHVMEEIFENKFETERLQSELDCIKNEISSMKNEVEKIEIHVEAMENRVEKITTNLDSFNDEAHLLAEEVKNIASRQDFLVEEEVKNIASRQDFLVEEEVKNIASRQDFLLAEETECSLAKYNEEDTPNQRENQSSNLITLVDNTENNDDNEKNQVNENNETENKELLSLEEMLETTELDQAEDDAKESDDPQSGEQTPKGKSDSDGELKQDVGPEDETNMIKDDCESVEDMDMDDEEDDDEEDEDFDDIENDGTDENDEEMFSSSHVQQERHYDHQRRMWDDNLILKCQHTALVPAFDPRPGRTNIQQTQDIQIPNEEHLPKKPHKKDEQDIYLFLRGIPFPGAKEIELPLDKEDASIFSFVQSLVLHGASNGVNSKTDRLRRVWEPTYTIIYKSSKSRPVIESQNVQPVETDVIRWSVAYVKEHLGSKLLPKSELISYLQENNTDDFLKKWKLIGSAKVCRRQRNCSVLISSYKEFAKIKMEKAMNEPQQKEKTVKINAPMLTSTDDIEPIQQVLDVLKALFRLSEDNLNDSTFSIPPEDFLSKKLTNKLMQQIQDPLSLASGSLPLWCEYLVINYPTIFPFETRQTFFRATAFGCSRSIVWLQNMQDANLERARGHPTRRLETTEFRIGRLKHERVTVPRGENLLENAVRLMDFHAERKSVLEIEFENEEGTGLGPSLEFYALVAMAIQRNCLRMWVSMDLLNDEDDSRREELSTYSRHPNGLFPAPLPQDAIEMKETCKMFSFLGIFLAKCIQDNRLVDLPLSEPLFKMLCASKGKYSKLLRTLSHTSESLRDDLTTSESEDEDDTKTVDNVFETSLSTSVEKLDSHYFSDVLTNNDFELIHPNKAKFLRCLNNYIEKRHVIMDDQSLSELEKKNQLDDLLFTTEHGHECRLEDLGLTFQYIPSSSTYGFDAVELLPNGGEKMLCGENAEEYVSSLIDFTMHKGIARQLEAFRAGFNRVFPMEKLHAFKAHEIRLMLCGDQAPSWTYDELVQYTEPKYGYHKDSPGFVRLLNVLVEMSGDERKAFLQFATGCSSLPPGGLANLHPRLTVVKKEDEGDGSYPSVNTCVHYLKLPEYSSEVVLRDRLLAATNEKGFHLN